MARRLATTHLVIGRAGASTCSELAVAALPSLAGKWLSPRLHRFSEDNPDLDLIVFAEDRIADLSNGEADVALRLQD